MGGCSHLIAEDPTKIISPLLSSLSGKHRNTVSRWLSSYRKGGISKMVDIYKSSGRKPEIPPEIQQALIKELNEKEGFSSYKEIRSLVICRS